MLLLLTFLAGPGWAVPLEKVVSTVRPGQSLSTICYNGGIGRPDSPLRLYGERSFLPVIAGLNPKLDLKNLNPGDKLVLLVPQGLKREPGFHPIIEPLLGYDKPYRMTYEWLALKPGENLSSLLFARGIGTPESPHRLYGRNGWIEHNNRLNDGLALRSLASGTRLLLQYPTLPETAENLSHEVQQPSAQNPIRTVATSDTRPPPPPPPRRLPKSLVGPPKMILTKRQQEVVEKPETAEIEDIVELPPEEIEKVDKKVMKEKLSSERIAKLDAKTVKKIPKAVRQEKAWEFSIWDSLDPNMDGFLDGVTDTTASGYLGTRFAQSLALNDPLMKNLQIVGLLLEMRGSWMDGLRLYYDLGLPSTAEVLGDEQNIEFNRLLAAWGFGFDPGFLVSQIHVTPRIGQYGIKARLPVSVNPDGTQNNQDFEIDGALATGLEVDLEWSSLFYILRTWYAQDLSLVKSDAGATVSSSRVGVDAFLKGSGFSLFGSQLSLAYLAFVANESLSLEQSGEESYAIQIQIPYAGLGLSTSW